MSAPWSAWVPVTPAAWAANPAGCEHAARALLAAHANQAGVSLSTLTFTVLHPVEVNHDDPPADPVIVVRAEGTRP